MKGVFLDWGSLAPADLDRTILDAALPQWQFYETTNAKDLADRIGDATVVVTNKVCLGAAEIANAAKLQHIAIAATGTNNVDLTATRVKRISVSHVEAYGTNSVVQHVFSLILALNRNLQGYRDDIFAGKWHDSDQFCLLHRPVVELQQQTLGIIGYGVLGQAVAKLAQQAFGMKVLIAARSPHDRRQGRVPLAQLLRQSDIISLHCSLTEETQGLIGASAFRLMQPHTLLINCARGGLVDEQALLEALQQGKIGGAALDVLEQEPPAKSSILLQKPLPNLLITPHMAWIGRNARQTLLNQVAENITAFVAGKPLRLVR